MVVRIAHDRLGKGFPVLLLHGWPQTRHMWRLVAPALVERFTVVAADLVAARSEQHAGVWQRLHRMLLQRLADADRIDWSRASADAARVPAKRGAPRPGRIRSTAARRAPTTT